MATFPGWEQAVLQGIGAPVTTQNVQFLDLWQSYEQSGATNNPLNTTQPALGSSNFNSDGVKDYPSASVGAVATAATLTNGRYPDIVSALQSGKPVNYLLNHPNILDQLRTWGSGTFADYLAKGGSANAYPGQNVVTGAQNAANAVASGAESTASFLAKITDPTNLLRGLQIVAGGVLTLVGMYLLVRTVGLGSPSLPDSLSPAARQAQAAQAQLTQDRQTQTADRQARTVELHESRVKLNQARATELRTRTKHRRRAKQEQDKELDRAYIRGAADVAPLGG